MNLKFEIKKSKDGQWFFNLRSAILEILVISEMYKAKQSVHVGIDAVFDAAASIEYFQHRTAKNRLFYFVIIARNGEIVGTSKMFQCNQERITAIETILTGLATAEIVEKY